jgi:hypothetical protein
VSFLIFIKNMNWFSIRFLKTLKDKDLRCLSQRNFLILERRLKSNTEATREIMMIGKILGTRIDPKAGLIIVETEVRAEGLIDSHKEVTLEMIKERRIIKESLLATLVME